MYSTQLAKLSCQNDCDRVAWAMASNDRGNPCFTSKTHRIEM